MDNAALQAALRIDCFNRLEHSAQTVRAEQVYVLYSPGFEVVQHIQPEFAAFVLPNPDTKDVFSTVHRDAKDNIGSLGDIAMILFDLVVDRVHKHKGVYIFQRTILPGSYLRHNLLADLRD